MNDGAGSYNCLCPSGFLTGMDTSGKPTCVLGEWKHGSAAQSVSCEFGVAKIS